MGKLYRIQIEVNANAGDEARISDELMKGIECDGFVILGYNRSTDDPHSLVMHHITLGEISEMIASNDELMRAAVIGMMLHGTGSFGEVERKSSNK